MKRRYPLMTPGHPGMGSGNRGGAGVSRFCLYLWPGPGVAASRGRTWYKSLAGGQLWRRYSGANAGPGIPPGCHKLRSILGAHGAAYPSHYCCCAIAGLRNAPSGSAVDYPPSSAPLARALVQPPGMAAGPQPILSTATGVGIIRWRALDVAPAQPLSDGAGK